jgi:hypothetical protein
MSGKSENIAQLAVERKIASTERVTTVAANGEPPIRFTAGTEVERDLRSKPTSNARPYSKVLISRQVKSVLVLSHHFRIRICERLGSAFRTA